MLGIFFPPVPSVAVGYAVLVALLWRKQSRAVEAIEGRGRGGVLARQELALRAPEAAAPARHAQDRAGRPDPGARPLTVA